MQESHKLLTRNDFLENLPPGLGGPPASSSEDVENNTRQCPCCRGYQFHESLWYCLMTLLTVAAALVILIFFLILKGVVFADCPIMFVDLEEFPVFTDQATIVFFVLDEDKDEENPPYNYTKLEWEIFCKITPPGAAKECVASVWGDHHWGCDQMMNCTESQHFCKNFDSETFDPTNISDIVRIWKIAFESQPLISDLHAQDNLFKLGL